MSAVGAEGSARVGGGRGFEVAAPALVVNMVDFFVVWGEVDVFSGAAEGGEVQIAEKEGVVVVVDIE